jgi:DNA-binding transcriptional LysR family regulator
VADVDWVGWPPALAHLPPQPQLAALIPGFTPVFTSDDFLVQLRAAEAGVGAIILERRRTKRAPTPLVELELDFGGLTATSYLVCAKSALAIARVRAVADLLLAELTP